MIARSFPSLLLAIAVLFALGGCSGDDEPAGDPGSDPFGNAGSAGAGAGDDGDGSGAPGTGSDDSDSDDGTGGGSLGDPFLDTLASFPGSGTSDAGEPLENGMLCDSVPGVDLPIPEAIQECYVDKLDPTRVAATLEQVLECVEEDDTVHIRLTFHPWFVDNTYGANAIGWDPAEAMTDPMMAAPMMRKGKAGGGHTFKDLVGSDHAEILLKDDSGTVVMQFKLDYLTEDAASPSGYASLGVSGGEGKMIIGDAAHVVRWMTSEDRNLNERGYSDYIVDSPATDEDYAPNSSTPEWDYRVVYEAWIALEAFGDGGFGGATIEFVHASPSKAESNTIEVEPGECPPPPCTNDPDEPCGDTDEPPPPPPPCGGSDPDAVCSDAGVPTDEPPPPPCGGSDPDAVCADAGLPPDEEGPDCEMFPDQCMVD